MLNNTSEIHDHHPIGHVANDRQIMADEEIGEAEFILQIKKQIEDLRADGNIQGGDRLIRHHDPGLRHQSTRNGDALPLPAGQHVRITAGLIGAQSDLCHHRQRRVMALLFGDTANRQRFLQDRGEATTRIQ